jgi:3-carboxy-cis,cis-muconate cycloisomerase
MSDRRIHPNATAMDSDIYRDIFGTTAMREVWSHQARIQVFCLSAGALAQAKYMLSGLVVHPENMKKNLRLTDGLINTEAVMMALGPKMGRSKAHDRLTTISIAVSEGKGRLIDLLSNDPEIAQILDRFAIERLMEPTNYLGNSGAMVDRVVAGRGD